MKVTLLQYTPEAEKVVASAARLCYSPLSGEDIMVGFSDAEAEAFLGRLIKSGHLSPFEHASFTFAIDGVSRVLSHQLVRHRIGASYSQKSQRYVKEGQFDYVTPQSVKDNAAAAAAFDQTMAFLQQQYESLLDLGIKAEDARYLLPNACTTNLIVTMNARSLLHFFELRCCVRAQQEIRLLANQMLEEVRQVAPLLFKNAGASCDTYGVCYEGKMSCGKDVLVLTRDKSSSQEG